jgi:hypothetical protein
MTSPEPCAQRRRRVVARCRFPGRSGVTALSLLALPSPGTPSPSGPRARERELNRPIPELKMIRLLQNRLDDDTIEVDGSRPKKSDLTPEERREIESLKTSRGPAPDPGQNRDFKLSFARTSGLDRRES